MFDATAWTADGERWYARWVDRVVDELRRYVVQDNAGKPTTERAFTDTMLEVMREWYLANAARFCEWVEPLLRNFYPEVSEEPWRGLRQEDWMHQLGSWRVDEEAMLAARGDARNWAANELLERDRRAYAQWAIEEEASRYPTLEGWIERSGTRAHRGAPREPSAQDLLDVNAATRLRGQRERVAHYCRSCGSRFTPKPRTAVRCAACRAAARGAS